MHTRTRVWFVLMVTITALVGVVAPSGAADKLGEVTYFSTGITPGAYVQSITAGPDDNLWFTATVSTEAGLGGRIGRITPDGEITEFAAGLSPDAGPGEITAGPDGNLWFTESGTASGADGVTTFGRLGRITPDGVITEFTAGLTAAPNAITAGPDGNLWFTGDAGDGGATGKIGRITPDGVITEFSAGLTPIYSGSVGGITAGPDGNLWFTETFRKFERDEEFGFDQLVGADAGVARITPDGVITEFTDRITSSETYLITAGCDGNLWFAANARIGRVTPKGKLTEFRAGTPNAGTGGLTAGPDGNVWFTEGGAVENGGSPPQIVRVTPKGKVTEFSTGSTPDTVPTGITAGPDGNLWFVENGDQGTGRIGRIGAGPTKESSGRRNPKLPDACPRARR